MKLKLGVLTGAQHNTSAGPCEVYLSWCFALPPPCPWRLCTTWKPPIFQFPTPCFLRQDHSLNLVTLTGQQVRQSPRSPPISSASPAYKCALTHLAFSSGYGHQTQFLILTHSSLHWLNYFHSPHWGNLLLDSLFSNIVTGLLYIKFWCSELPLLQR